MTRPVLYIEAQPLRLKLKTVIRHAAAARNEGESIWVRAGRNGRMGYGEGCPRIYVAGDEIETSITWINSQFASGRNCFHTLAELRRWVKSYEETIDRYPSAWCAVEMAVLDLLAREAGVTVEALLGVKADGLHGHYTAVLGDDKQGKYASLVDKYLMLGLVDFKVKLSGDLARDAKKLDIIERLSEKHRSGPARIRLDANNLWKERGDEAIAHMLALGCGRIFAVEEPVGARQAADISRFSTATGLPVILDESLCNAGDLELFRGLPGRFIANIKLSRLGGIVRALGMLAEIKKVGWPVIIGCHVGETSLLTRAALVVAAAAGKSLAAQEGAFGDYLVEGEPVRPILKFGYGGLLDLQIPYCFQTARGVEVVAPDNWSVGFGMQGSMPSLPAAGMIP